MQNSRRVDAPIALKPPLPMIDNDILLLLLLLLRPVNFFVSVEIKEHLFAILYDSQFVFIYEKNFKLFNVKVLSFVSLF